MVCYATSDLPRCQCIVRDSDGGKLYEVTLPASTPASSLLQEVASKINKFPDQISLIYQSITQVVEITQGTQGSLEDLGLKISHNRNNFLVKEINGSGSSSGSSVSSTSHSWEQGPAEANPGNEAPTSEAGATDAAPSGGGILRMLPQAPPVPFTSICNNQRTKKKWKSPGTLFSSEGSSTLQAPSTSLLSVSSPNFVGLVNQAMTCYLNSLLQALYMTPEFRNALYKWKFDGDKPTKSIPFQLQKLFLNLQTSSRCAVETTELTLSFGWGTGDVWHQHDVQELCRVMFDALEQEFKNTTQADLINHLYQGKMIDYVKCLECEREKFREDTFLDIPLPVRPYGSTVAYSSIEEAMRAFVTPEILDGNNQYYCENCKKKCNAHKGLKFSKFPYLLTLHLKRFDFDYTTLHRIKLNDKVVFPEVLELDYFLKSPTTTQMEMKCDDGSTSTADSALGDDTASTSAAPPLPPELNSPPTDHELNEDEGIEISLGGGSGSSSSSSGSYSGSESCDPQVASSEAGAPRDSTQDANPPSCDTQGICDSGSVCDLRSPLSGSLPPDGPDQTTPQIEEANAGGGNTPNFLGSSPSPPAPPRPQAEYRYELYSIMIHSGSASGGHYYAYIKDFCSNQWFCFNDQSVTRVTVEDIEKSYGGGPTRGYYSGVFSSSTNAYMLMYRLIDPDCNTLPMTPDEFPPHIKALVEEMRAFEEQERRMRARDEETLKVKVCYQSNQTKVFVHRDDPFLEALKQAYDNLQLEGHVRMEDCRLVSYGITRDSRDCSLEDHEEDTMGNVLAYLKTNNCSIDFLLETKHPNLFFPIYRPDDLRIDVCRVNVPREEVLGVQQVQVPIGVKVGGLKEHLRLLIPDLLPPAPTDLVLVMNLCSSIKFPAFYHLSDENFHIRQVIDSATYFKIFVAPMTPALAADLENGFEKSNFLKLLKKVENVVILHIALPEVNEDILERFLIPLLSEQKSTENNNKQDYVNEVQSQTSGSNVQEEENAGASAVTSSDQSTSEDSSLTDSERTIIGEPPQLEGQLSSPSDSEQLSSPETNMTMEINGDVDDGDSDEMDNRLRCNRDYYIKVTPYSQNGQRMVKIVVDKHAEWSLVEKCLEPCCGVPRQYLLVTTGNGDVVRPSDTVRTLFVLKNCDYLSVRLHRPLAQNEYKKKVYQFLPNSPQPFQYLCEWIVVQGQSVGESKKALLKYLDKRNFLHIPYNRCRLRRKNWKAVGSPWLDTDTWDEPARLPEELLLEELESEDGVTSHDIVPVFVRRVCPSTLTFSHFFEILIDTTKPFDLVNQLSEKSNIPVENIGMAKSSHTFPWEMSVYIVLQDLDWSQDTEVLSNPNFRLVVDEYTPIILYRDSKEEKKKLDVNDIDWSDTSSLYDRYGTNPRRSTERLAMQSPRKEKPLKIYLQTKNTNSPNSSSSNTTTASENTNSCYVPPPDYDY